MNNERNGPDQPLGFLVPGWSSPPLPRRETMAGTYCRLEPLDPDRHAASLHAANLIDTQNWNWTYLPYGPFDAFDDYRAWMERDCLGIDPLFFAVIDQTDKAVGVVSYLRIDPGNGSIEVGHINYSPLLQRTAAATEAMFLMMKRIFDLGYRRYEWKCNALNAASRTAAQRLGFSFEGIFRQAAVLKGRNRDTSWYAIIDKEWPDLREAFIRWLEPSNFDERGQQKTSLTTLTAPVLNRRG